MTRPVISVLAALAALLAPASASALRPLPNTDTAVHVWDDQLPDSMSPTQIRFVATHVDGTQKVSRQTAERLRAVNAGFLVLHYRLAIGDGPVPFRIGDRWASDYGSVTGHESWFWHQDGRRVFQSQWGWYLMNPDATAHTLTLTAPARRVEPIGGGALDAGADSRGWRLRLPPVGRTIALPAHSGVVLVNG